MGTTAYWLALLLAVLFVVGLAALAWSIMRPNRELHALRAEQRTRRRAAARLVPSEPGPTVDETDKETS